MSLMTPTLNADTMHIDGGLYYFAWDVCPTRECFLKTPLWQKHFKSLTQSEK